MVVTTTCNKIYYLSDSICYLKLLLLLDGNVDKHTIKENQLDGQYLMMYVRMYPKVWNEKPSLRFEIMGCHYSKLLERDECISIMTYNDVVTLKTRCGVHMHFIYEISMH